MKPVLMIHEIREEFFTLPLENYILTFDDGLFSQFYFWKEFEKIPTKKIFFISSGIICEDVPQSTKFITCRDAHQKVRERNNKEDYMTLEQIKFLMECPNVEIGGHSHAHRSLKNVSLTDLYGLIKTDTELMINWFIENLGFKPTSFCFPYNDDRGGIYKQFLSREGFSKFYGRERIAIESLFETRSATSF